MGVELDTLLEVFEGLEEGAPLSGGLEEGVSFSRGTEEGVSCSAGFEEGVSFSGELEEGRAPFSGLFSREERMLLYLKTHMVER